MHLDTYQVKQRKEISKRVLGEVRGTFCIRFHEVPCWGVVVGNSQLEVLGISGAAGKWYGQASI